MQDQAKLDDTLTLLKCVWTLFLVALYMACFLNEYKFPGFRDTPLEGEEVYWKVQRIFYFGLLTVGFLADLVQLKMDRRKAFMFLLLSLLLGGLASVIGVYQFQAVNAVLQAVGYGR